MKVLYVDNDFRNKQEDGAIKRSKFLFQVLNKFFDVDLVLVDNEIADVSLYSDVNTIFINPLNSKKYMPANCYQVSSTDQEKFLAIIAENDYLFVFFRFYVHWSLYKLIKGKVKVLFDVDLLFSKLALTALKTKFFNRYYLVEFVKLYFFEKIFLKEDLTLFFANYLESKSSMRKSYTLPNPIVQKQKSFCQSYRAGNILFYGNLNASINKAGFSFYIKEIYPHLKRFLLDEGLKVDVVGRGDLSFYRELIKKYKVKNVNLVGEVSDLDSNISKSSCVIFPILNFSGTLTRIMESIHLNEHIVVTSNLSKSLNESTEILNSNNPQMFANYIIQTIKYPGLSSGLDHLKRKFSADTVIENFKSVLLEVK